MIVPSMSPAEVVREAISDLPAVWNKFRSPIDRLMREAKVNKRIRDKERLEAYRSPEGNNWLVLTRPNKKMVNVALFVWYWGTDERLRAARIQDDGVSYHLSAHMLEQYFERFNRLPGKLERLKEFAKENMDVGAEYSLDGNELRCGIRHGYLIGHWLVPHQIGQLTTFVDHGKLFTNQLEQMERLDQQRYASAHPGRRPTPGYVHPWIR